MEMCLCFPAGNESLHARGDPLCGALQADFRYRGAAEHARTGGYAREVRSIVRMQVFHQLSD